MTEPDKLREITERNKRSQGSHVQREDIEWLLAEIERLQSQAKYVKPFGEAMNDYHQAYLRERKKVEELQKRCTTLQGECFANGYYEQEVRRLEAKLGAAQKAFSLIISNAGHPNAVTACVLAIDTAKAALSRMESE